MEKTEEKLKGICDNQEMYNSELDRVQMFIEGEPSRGFKRPSKTVLDKAGEMDQQLRKEVVKQLTD